MKKFLRLAIILAVLVALIVAIHVGEGWRGRRAWTAYRADAERRGVKLALEDYLPPPVPDAENFAAIPFFQEVFCAAENEQPPLKSLDFPLASCSRYGMT